MTGFYKTFSVKFGLLWVVILFLFASAACGGELGLYGEIEVPEAPEELKDDGGENFMARFTAFNSTGAGSENFHLSAISFSPFSYDITMAKYLMDNDPVKILTEGM